MKKLIAITLTLLVFGPAFGQTTYSKEIEDQIHRVENNLAGRVVINGKRLTLKERMAQLNIKGVTIAVIHNYKLEWARGYGWADEAGKVAVTEKTRFHAASVTKSINGMSVLRLAQDKKLDLDRDINDYLVSWKFPYDSVSKGKKITTRLLLSHTAGLSNSAPMYPVSGKIPTVVQDLSGTPPSDAPPVKSIMVPDTRFQYSNPGIAITQVLINDITHKSYDRYVTETVFRQLGMTNSGYAEDSLKKYQAVLATGYDLLGVPLIEKRVAVSMSAAGGLWTTPTDLSKYIIELQLATEGRSNKVLNREMASLMVTPYKEGAAMGVFIDERGGTKHFSHSGAVAGFKSFYIGSLQGGDGVVVMVNSENGQALIDEIVNSVATAYDWKGYYQPIEKNEITVDESIIKKYEGIYLFENTYAIILKKKDGYYYLSDGIYSKMHFTSEKEFFNAEFSSEKKMLIDENGKAKGYLRRVGTKEFPTATKITNADTLNRPGGWINNIGWYLLENKQYELAMNFLNRGIKLAPEDPSAVGNMGHCLLFTNQFEKAIKTYKEHFAMVVNSNPQMKNMVVNDFLFFKNNGFDRAPMDKAIAQLNLKMPDEYYK